jgi:hypothetical protein
MLFTPVFFSYFFLAAAGQDFSGRPALKKMGKFFLALAKFSAGGRQAALRAVAAVCGHLPSASRYDG